MIRRPPRSTHCISSAASDVYKRQVSTQSTWAQKREETQYKRKLEQNKKKCLNKKQEQIEYENKQQKNSPYNAQTKDKQQEEGGLGFETCKEMKQSRKKPQIKKLKKKNRIAQQHTHAELHRDNKEKWKEGAKTKKKNRASTYKNKSKNAIAVSYTHLTLPTICSVQISVVAVSFKKKKKMRRTCEGRSRIVGWLLVHIE
eukprot:TRINITY_DN16481_c0_g1_i2.p2 TRINITY_DN16481_c0_g1~~TRINITY_DN16481_c0_g1_i2.p2  ORF type:complete len:200 (+),score=52.82 TRINITY_DN16481_c0_g1_i2:132-731(+)